MMSHVLVEFDYRLREYARQIDRANRESWKYQDALEGRGRSLRERIGGMLERSPRRLSAVPA